jgi:hypothetical protein
MTDFTITREQLSQFLPNPRLVRAFEDLIKQTLITTPTATDYTLQVAQIALAIAGQALARESEDREEAFIVPGPKGADGLNGLVSVLLEDPNVEDVMLGQSQSSVPIITGSRAANPALASLLTAMAQRGLIIDATTI